MLFIIAKTTQEPLVGTTQCVPIFDQIIQQGLVAFNLFISHLNVDVSVLLKYMIIVACPHAVSELRPSRNMCIRLLNSDSFLRHQIIKVHSSAKIEAVPLAKIEKKCVHVKILTEGNSFEYLIPHPNSYEYH